MKLGNRIIAATLAGAMALGMVAMPASAAAQNKQAAKERQHRVTATALGAAGLYLYGRKQTTLGTIALAGSAYEAKRMQDEINNRHKRARLNAYHRGYRTGYRSGTKYAYSHSRYRTGSSKYYYVRRNGKLVRVKRGTTWAATRGKKKGWYKNGKFTTSVKH